MTIPLAFRGSAHASRLEAAVQATRGAGEALLAIRGERFVSVDHGDQLKTSVDRAAEGWVVGFLRGTFSSDVFLSEEAFEERGAPWRTTRAYWTVDALDGTRSYVENYPGFCVQVALIEDGQPVLGVIHEPVAKKTFAAIRGHGAYVGEREDWCELSLGEPPSPPRFVDSIRPSGPIGAVMTTMSAGFVECGSFGLKMCRVAEGRADVFAKDFRFKLWDVAPGEVIAEEAGARVGRLSGERVVYDTEEVRFLGLLVAHPALFDPVVAELAKEPR